MNVLTRRRACLGLLLVMGCGSGDLPAVPPIPKDYKPVQPAPIGVAPRPPGLKKAAGANSAS